MRRNIPKRAAALLLAAGLALCAGCSRPHISLPEIEIPMPDMGLFDRSYSSVSDYTPQSEESTETAASDSISDYDGLVRAISATVSRHEESATLQLQNYDGTVSDDLSAACWEVKSSTALGAFAVDYISYDISRIVSYYQAEIHITYKRSAYQVEACETVANLAALSDRLQRALQDEESYLVLEMGTAAATADTAQEMLEDLYYSDALLCPVKPEITAEVFSGSSMTRIIEITISYGADSDTLSEKSAQLSDAAEALVVQAGLSDAASAEPAEDDIAENTTGAETAEEESAAAEEADAETADESDADEDTAETDTAETSPEQTEADRLYALCSCLVGDCTIDPAAGDTAWDALVQHTADEEGLAMALQAACQTLDIPCYVVRGWTESAAHCWNIVCADGAYYHIDLSAWGTDGEDAFLLGDEQMRTECWWDFADVPVCEDSYYYFGRPSDELSGYPSSEELSDRDAAEENSGER